MDYSKPIAKRTRGKEALYFKELHAKLKKRKRDDDEVSIDVDESENDDVQVIGEVEFASLKKTGSSSKSKLSCEKGEKKFGSFDDDDGIQCVDISQSGDSEELGKSREEKNDDWNELGTSSSSSEEEIDDEDFRVGDECENLEESNSGEHSEGDDDDDDVSIVKERGSNDWKGKEKRVKGGLKRGKVDELDDAVVDSSDENVEEESDATINLSKEEHKNVAQRTRSRSGSKIKEKRLKLGTAHRPFCIDVEEDDSILGDFGGSDENEGNCSETKVGGEVEGKLGKPTRRKQANAAKKLDVIRILIDSVREKSKGWSFTEEETQIPIFETSLPLKFRFGVEELNVLEKSEEEREMDQLWKDFDLALMCSKIGSTNPVVVDNNDSTSLDVGADPVSLCSRGNHEFILDEQIGLICRICSFVNLEIKYFSPPFARHPWGRPEKKGYSDADVYSNELQFQDSGCDARSSCKSGIHGKGTVWDIIPGIFNTMYEHQREGFEFIWKIMAGTILLEELKKSINFSGGSGCVISHAPGTGKTRLIIVFLQTFIEKYPSCRPIIIAPRSMLLTWEEEFKKWGIDIPFHNLNKNELSGMEDPEGVSLFLRNRQHCSSITALRALKLYSWQMGKSILGVSYMLFEKLAGVGVSDGAGKRKHKFQDRTANDSIRNILLEHPGLLVLDEGHIPRNKQSLIWKALSKVKTKRRIILSGTPFQNNFDELYNILCLVIPSLADGPARAKWTSLAKSSGKLADGLEEVIPMINASVHVHKGTILQDSLPGLRDSVIVLQPGDFQKSILESIQNRNYLELEYMVSLTSVHPSLLLCLSSEEKKLGLEKLQRLRLSTDKLKRLRLSPDAGVKTKFVMELIRLSEAINEKVLVFSQYIQPLCLIKDQLKSQYNWIEGKEVLYMDGQSNSKQKQSSINTFNDSATEVRVLLASTKACSEGINLVGASRVVLLDVVWNPAVERQAISRAYRLGQKKVVYVYHLITSGTIEGEKYCRQVEKDRLSEMVFCSSQKECDLQKISKTVSDDKILEEMVQHEKLKDMFDKIIYQPKESNLIDTFGLGDL